MKLGHLFGKNAFSISPFSLDAVQSYHYSTAPRILMGVWSSVKKNKKSHCSAWVLIIKIAPPFPQSNVFLEKLLSVRCGDSFSNLSLEVFQNEKGRRGSN